MRYCTGCKKKLPASKFYSTDKRKRTRCKTCKRKKVKEYNDRIKKEQRCFHCRQPLDESDKRLCIKCKARNRVRYHENGDRNRAAGKKRRRDLKLEVFKAYGGSECACCEEWRTQFLTIDHTDGNGAKHRRSLPKKYGGKAGSHFYRWLRDQGYPKGYQVLCFNCNFAKGHFEECPHEAERRSKAS